MKAILIMIIAFSLAACYSEKNLLIDFDTASKSLVDSLNKYESVESEFIGYSAEESKSYQIFVQIKDKLDTEKLVTLTDHKNPAVRVYAFWALCLNRYPDFDKILENHLKDKEKFWYTEGCIMSLVKVNSFYLGLVNPEYTLYDGIKLSREEYEMYSSRIK